MRYLITFFICLLCGASYGQKSGFTLEQLQGNPQDAERICFADGLDTLDGWKIHSYDIIEGYGFTIVDADGVERPNANEVPSYHCNPYLQIIGFNITPVCFYDGTDLKKGYRRTIHYIGNTEVTTYDNDGNFIPSSSITPCIVDSEFCSYAGESATILYDEVGGFWVRTLANPTVLVAGDVSLLGSCGGGTTSVNSNKKAEGRIVQNGSLNNSNNIVLPYLFGATVNPTGNGADSRKYEVRFDTPLPAGTDYVPSVSGISNEPQGDEAKVLVIKGSINENGFDVITTIDDNGAGEDTQVFLSFLFEVNLK